MIQRDMVCKSLATLQYYSNRISLMIRGFEQKDLIGSDAWIRSFAAVHSTGSVWGDVYILFLIGSNTLWTRKRPKKIRTYLCVPPDTSLDVDTRHDYLFFGQITENITGLPPKQRWRRRGQEVSRRTIVDRNPHYGEPSDDCMGSQVLNSIILMLRHQDCNVVNWSIKYKASHFFLKIC